MFNKLFMQTTSVITLGALLLAGCASGAATTGAAAATTVSSEAAAESTSESTTAESAAERASEAADSDTVTIRDAHGEVTVKKNPAVVISLDNRTFQTLSDWNIPLAAVPKDVMPANSPYVLDESVQNIGNHREPNLELLAGLEPDLVIVGQRFVSFYEDIKALVPDADVIDLTIDVSEKNEHPGKALEEDFKHYTTVLGDIFGREKEAMELNASFDAAVLSAKEAYNPEKKVLSVIISGGNIGFSAPKTGRVFGPLYEILSLTPALEVDGSTTDHQGDEISVEAIAQSNPDYIFVLDRDAGVSAEGAQSAADIIDNSEALKNVTAVTEGNIVYAPSDTYVNESIQTFVKLLTDIAAAFKK